MTDIEARPYNMVLFSSWGDPLQKKPINHREKYRQKILDGYAQLKSGMLEWDDEFWEYPIFQAIDWRRSAENLDGVDGHEYWGPRCESREENWDRADLDVIMKALVKAHPWLEPKKYTTHDKEYKEAFV